MLEPLIGRGIVINHSRYLDDDARLTVFLRDAGKIQVLCKGTQKITAKLRPLTELFVEADFQIAIAAHAVTGRMIGGRLLESHRALCDKYTRFEAASRFCETVDALLPARAPAPEVFDILRQSLEELKVAPDTDSAWTQFVIKLLKNLGHGDLPASDVLDELERLLPRRLKSAP